MHARWLAPARTLFAALADPAGAWLAFNISLVLWHLPGPYDLTLRGGSMHVLEHAMFLATGILFWSLVAATAPARGRLSTMQRLEYLAGAAVVNVGLSMYLGFPQHPLYGAYASLAHRPGGISALADRQMGAGFMWTGGDMPFAIAIAVLVQRWLAEQEAKTARLATLPNGPVDAQSPSDGR